MLKSPTYKTLVEAVSCRAEIDPALPLYSFIAKDGRRGPSISSIELLKRTRALAANLQRKQMFGERILLFCYPVIESIIGLYGALQAGCIVVPVPPLRRPRGARARLDGIMRDCNPIAAIGAPPDLWQSFSAEAISDGLEPVDVSRITNDMGEEWKAPHLRPADIAVLQYTSGSTSSPKGVTISHANLLSNLAHIHSAFGLSASASALIWLPFYHDMGLIAGVIQPLFSGYPVTFMSPTDFAEGPLRWLEFISRQRATVSGGPDSAYEACTRSASEHDNLQIDLSSWEVAFNGSEPVRENTMRRFSNAFGRYGFRATSFRPCYGLAEATLLVSAVERGRGYEALYIERDALKRNRVKMVERSNNAMPAVSVGAPARDLEVRIVNAELRRQAKNNELGEIWVSGPSVARGYWGNDENGRMLFDNVLDGDRGVFLRTGDLGFLENGELYVVGRTKDVIIIHGHNYYPEDIEEVIERHSDGKCHKAAAFSIQDDGKERLIIVIELKSHDRATGSEKITGLVRQCLAEEFQLSPDVLVFVRRASLPRTTSGKIQRTACRDRYLSGRLRTVAVDTANCAEMKLELTLPHEATLSPDLERKIIVLHGLKGMIAKSLRVPAELISSDKTLVALGLDSLAFMQVKTEIQRVTGVTVPIEKLVGHSLGQLADLLAEQAGDASEKNKESIDEAKGAIAYEVPLSAGQKAMWFLQELAPHHQAYSISRAMRVLGPLNHDSLKASFKLLGIRHPTLRLRISISNGDLVQSFSGDIGFEEIDVSRLSKKLIQERLNVLAAQRFDLQAGPVCKVYLLTERSDVSILLFCVHHIAADLWSLGVLLGELAVAYEAHQAGVHPKLPPLSADYRDFVQWQARMLSGPEGQQHWQYWKERLEGPVPRLKLLSSRECISEESATHYCRLDRNAVSKLKEVCRKDGVTLRSGLLSLFAILLYRYTDQDDLLLGTLAAGRSHPRFANVVGYLVNPVVLRLNLGHQSTFHDVLARTQLEVATALDHQDFPFSKLVERTQPLRDGSRPPLLQAMCICQPMSLGHLQDAAGFMLSRDGSSFQIGDLTFQSVALESIAAEFDIALICAESAGEIECLLQSNSERLDQPTVTRMAKQLIELLNGASEMPEQTVRTLPMVSDAEYRELIAGWSHNTEMPKEDICIHEAFRRQAHVTPTHVALVHRGEQLSYKDLDEKAWQIGRHLKELGVGPETRVGLFLDRSIDMVAGLLGIMYSGGAYVPLDPNYPNERLNLIANESEMQLIVTQRKLMRRLDGVKATTVCVEDIRDAAANEEGNHQSVDVVPDNAAYVMFTSGSTGRPKGVVVQHRNVMNLFRGIDEKVNAGPNDTLIAVTSISFDISILELLWTLINGVRVIIVDEESATSASRRVNSKRRLQFSVFYFASVEGTRVEDKYRLLIDGAKYADQHGFAAVWTPERHFHAFGGLYPNPSITSAALAAITESIGLRAGSVVMPLHHPVRVAEEWSLVDNLSHGRAGIAVASGWQSDDFVFHPENYVDRKAIAIRGIEVVRRLWRGESVSVVGVKGKEYAVSLYPKPIQSELPIWVTSAGSVETFVTAGSANANLLTHLLGQDIRELSEKIRFYRRALTEHGHDGSHKTVTLMLHAYVDDNPRRVNSIAFGPFKQYLRSSLGLMANFIKSQQLSLDVDTMSEKDLDDLVSFAAERYMESAGLFGAPDNCLELIECLTEIGVDEVACLIDFGVDTSAALNSLERIDSIKDEFLHESQSVDYSVAAQARRHGATIMQCTPSLLQILIDSPGMKEVLAQMRIVLIGGESLPPALARKLIDVGVNKIFNMYGPTETTIWSMAKEVQRDVREIRLGGPLINTQIHVLTSEMRPLPIGIFGEVFIGGDGVARGYLEDPALTAERFVPNPFSGTPGSRLYRTGDVARIVGADSMELLGRIDDQFKLRGYRVELGDIEAVLNRAPGVQVGIAVKRDDDFGATQLVAYVQPHNLDIFDPQLVAQFIKRHLPAYMVPSAVVPLSPLPVSPNGKVDRTALSRLQLNRPKLCATPLLPAPGLETVVANIWKDTLHVSEVSVEDNFFDIGGHSLLMAQVHGRLQQVVGREFPLITMLERPTIRGIVQFLRDPSPQDPMAATGQAVREKRALLLQRERALALSKDR